MEVKEFVKTILKDVSEAVEESNSKKHHFLLPESTSDGIEFDLAILSKKGANGKIGAEIFSVGAKAEGNLSEEVVNRIKFKVNTWKSS